MTPDEDLSIEPTKGVELELNEPEKNTISRGPEEFVSKADRRLRLKAMEYLLLSATSDTEIENIMEKKFGMSEHMVRRYINRVFAQWSSEETHRGPYFKPAARRRIHGHIEGAKEDRNWQAVATLEKVLSGIEGTTVDPKETTPPVELRISESLRTIIGDMDQTTAEEIIERELTILVKETIRVER